MTPKIDLVSQDLLFDNVGNERALLAAILTLPNSVIEILDLVKDVDILSPHNKALFVCISSLYRERGITSFDITTVVNEAQRLCFLESCGGFDYIASLFNTKIQRDSVKVFVQNIIEHSSKKALFDQLTEMREEVKGNITGTSTKTSSALLTRAEERLSCVLAHSNRIDDAVDLSDNIEGFIVELKNSDPGIVGLSTGFPLLDGRINGLVPGSLTIVAARPKCGKCVSGDTEVFDAVSNCSVPIRDLKSKRVLSFSEGQLGFKSIYGPVCTGVKPVYRVKTRTGRTIKVTDNHPFLTPDGWADVISGSVRVGTPVAIAAATPFFGITRCSADELTLMAYWLAGGSRGGERISVKNKNVVSDIEACVKAIGCGVVHSTRRGSVTICVEVGWKEREAKQAYTACSSFRKPLRKLLLDFGCAPASYSYEKKVPPFVFSLTKDLTALFINRLFSGGGWVTPKEIGYASTSERLIDQLSDLLLKFGIVATKRVRPMLHRGRGGRRVYKRTSYALILQKKRCMLRFIEQIGCLGREKEIETVLSFLKNRKEERGVGDPPKEFVVALCRRFGPAGVLRLGKAVGCRLRTGRGIKNMVLARIAAYLNDKALLDLSSESVFWDEVVSIKKECEEPVYDLQVLDGDPVFVANGFIVHNSTLLTSWAKHLAYVVGVPVLYIDTEMYTKEIKTRVLSDLSGVREREISNGLFSADQEKLGRVIKAAEIMKHGSFYHRYLPGAPIDKIIGMSRRYHVNKKIGAVFFDYIKLPDGADLKNTKEHQVLGYITAALKDLAGTLNVPVVTAAQIGRTGANRGYLRPDMIADSDRLLRYCNNLLGLCSKAREELEPAREGKTIEEFMRYLDLHGSHRLQILETRAGGSLYEGINLTFQKHILRIRESDFQPYASQNTKEYDDTDF